MPEVKNPWRVSARVGDSAGEVAARTLIVRLETIPRLLDEAAGGRATGEAIHALRVGTRRCKAAIDAFEDLLPGRERRWFATRLRHLRRLAGKSRDLDVLLERLQARRGPSGKRPADRTMPLAIEGAAASDPGLTRAIDVLDRKKRATRKRIRAERERFSPKDWHRRVQRLIDGIARRRSREPFQQFAAIHLERASGTFLAAVGKRPRNSKSLHRLRIEAKKTRYAIEIFSGVLQRARKSAILETFEQFQDLAGICTDHAHAAGRFHRLGERATDGNDSRIFARLARAEASAAAAARRKFLAWLSAERVQRIAVGITAGNRS